MAVSHTKKQALLKGGEIISKMLAAEGIDTVFGIKDGTYLSLYSSFDANGIRLITPRHETSAVHMAGTYARLTGKLGVCLASNGPGMANALSGVAVENAEGNRVLLISSSRNDKNGNSDNVGVYQCFSQVQVTQSITKWNCTIPSSNRLSEELSKAFRLSFEGRPGVVHVDIPENIINTKCDIDSTLPKLPSDYRVFEPLSPTVDQVKKAANMLVKAKQPLIHAGTGIIHAQAFEELQELATLLEAPLSSSWGGRSSIDERLKYSIPMIYLNVSNKIRNEADVVLALGSRIGETDWWGKPPYWESPSLQKLIQVDLDAKVFGYNKPVNLAIQADVKKFMQLLIKEINLLKSSINLKERKAKIKEFQKNCALRRKQLDKHLLDNNTPMASALIPVICQEVFNDDAIVVIDGGNTSIWGLFFHQVRTPNTIVGTPKMGHLGAGVSQVIGAKVACPDRQVYCILGDGAMGFHQQEIETAIRYKLPVIYLVLCDKQWGMVKMNQLFTLKPLKTLLFKTLKPEETINSDIGETKFDQLAQSMGAYGERVSDPVNLKSAIKRALDSGKCSVIHIDVNPVKHMWAPNLKDFKDLHAEPKG